MRLTEQPNLVNFVNLGQLGLAFPSPSLTKFGPDLGITITRASFALVRIKQLQPGTQLMAFRCYLLMTQSCPPRIAGLSPHPAHQVPLGHPAGMIHAHQSPTQQTFLEAPVAICFPPSVDPLITPGTTTNLETTVHSSILYSSVAYSLTT